MSLSHIVPIGLSLWGLHILLGRLSALAIRQDRLSLALRLLQLSLLCWPFSKQNWVTLGNLYGDLHRWQRAHSIFQNLLRLGEHEGAKLGAGTAALALARIPEDSARAHNYFSTHAHIPPSVRVPPAYTHPDKHQHLQEFATRGWTVVDHFFTPEVIAAFYEYCQHTALWQHHYPGYEGAHLDSGLSTPLLYKMGACLWHSYPEIFASHQLMYAWAFRYVSDLQLRNQGVALHHDSAHINVNLWLTPDVYNQGDTGGLIVYPHAPPETWDLERYTLTSSQMRDFVKAKGLEPVRIPYRQGRMVIFNSRFLHASDRFQFGETPEQRRLNLTLLYGQQPLRYFPRHPLPERLFKSL